MPKPSASRPHAFPKSHRLRLQRDFDAVYKGGVAKTAGPLRVLGIPNALRHCRLGLNVSRRAGKAVVRNRIKRMLREAFRLSQHTLPAGYDLLVIARAHEPLKLADYVRLLGEVAGKLDAHWKKVDRVGSEPQD